MEYRVFSYTPDDLSLMPKRVQDSHKGTYGRLLCVCGSVGMAGAAYLCAKAALRTGAGLVEIFTPEQNRAVIQTLLPEAIVTPYCADEPDLLALEKAIKRADAVVCGCGLGTSGAALSILTRLLRTRSVPTLLDADALNLLSKNRSLLSHAAGCIITPHPLEMSRLTGLDVSKVELDRQNVCRTFASDHSLVCALKGHRTAVSNGEDVYVNTSGNSGMATAGSGDVLSGIIGGILAQNKSDGALSIMQIASLGVYIHGLCGEIAADRLCEYSVIASDLIDSLPQVLKQI